MMNCLKFGFRTTNASAISSKFLIKNFYFQNVKFVSINTIQKVNSKLKADEKFSPQYYEELISILPKTETGNIQFKKEVFIKALKDATNEADIEYMLNLIADFMGNYCPLSGNRLDDYVARAIELNCPNKVLPLLINHRQLMYYPNPQLIEEIIKLHESKNDWTSMKAFYSAIARKYYIKKPNSIYNIFIQAAYKNKEFDQCVNAFLDILDYQETVLDVETYKKVIYSNANLLKDKIFIELLEKSLKLANVESFGIHFPLLVYYYKQNKDDKVNLHLQKLEHANLDLNSTEVLPAPFIKEFLEEVTVQEGKENKTLNRIKDIIKNLKIDTVFDNFYKELLEKIKI